MLISLGKLLTETNNRKGFNKKINNIFVRFYLFKSSYLIHYETIKDNQTGN